MLFFFGTLEQFEVDEKSKHSAVLTKSITSTVVNPHARGVASPKAYMKLENSAHTIPIKITSQPKKALKESVNQEVETLLKEIGPFDKEKKPIAQQLLQKISENPQLESAKILRKAEKLSKDVSAILIPGGEDLPPALYGAIEDPQTHWDGDYRKSILELCMIHQAANKGIPLMGICRGFQLSNVYFGARLIQHVEGHQGVQKLSLTSPERRGIYSQVVEMKRLLHSYPSLNSSVKSCTTSRP